MKKRLWRLMPRLRLLQMSASSLRLSVACLKVPTSKGLPCVMASSMDPAPGSTPMAMSPEQVRQQQFPIVGNGEGVWSWLHIEDAAIATVAAAEQGNPGIYLIANDQPLAVREWLPAFAQWLNAPPPPQISVEDALKASGADAVYYGTQMRGASNAKAKRELDFQPRPLEWINGPGTRK